jgi:hypothetical protein
MKNTPVETATGRWAKKPGSCAPRKDFEGHRFFDAVTAQEMLLRKASFVHWRTPILLGEKFWGEM